MSGVLQDLRYALRTLTKSPGFVAVAVITLALGIGANTAIFTVVDTVLLRSLPYPDADRIVSVTRKGGGPIMVPMFSYWQQNNFFFDDLTAYDSGAVGLNLQGVDRPEFVQGLHVSERYFSLFGARPMLGRAFSADEDKPGGGQVLVLSYGLWERRFGADRSVLGKTISFGGAPYTVIGILSPSFQPHPSADVWLPLQADPNSTNQAHTLMVSARLRNGATLAQANSQALTIGKEYIRAHPEQLANDEELEVTPTQRAMTGSARPALLVLAGAVSLVLLIACANVANLLLVRAAGRQKEIAVRAALGAGRGRVVRQLLAESFLLALTGGLLGLALGSWGVRALLALAPGDLPRAQEMTAIPALNPWVASFSVLLSAIAAVLFGVFPSIHASRTDLTSVLKQSSVGKGDHDRARKFLVSAEVAIAVVLVSGAVLLMRSFAALHNQELGFDPENLLTMKVSLAGPRFASASNVDRITRDLVKRVERIPGVEAAALANNLPLESGVDIIFNIPGHPPVPGFKFTGDEQWRFVSAHYFDTLRIPLRAGRLLRDGAPAPAVVINEALARKFFPGTSAVGQTIQIGAGLGPEFENPPAEIVGVVGDVRENRLEYDAPPVIYQLQSQVPDGLMKFVNTLLPQCIVVRTKPGIEPLSVSHAVQAALLGGETQLAATAVRSMDQLSLNSTARQNFNLLLMGVFATIAVLLAAVGIYGVMSYTLEQRTHEMGIRTALGASRGQMLRLIIGQGFRMTMIGIALGIAGAFTLARFMSGLLYGVTPRDPTTFLAVAIFFGGVALFASYIPARRAAKVDPMVALRYE